MKITMSLIFVIVFTSLPPHPVLAEIVFVADPIKLSGPIKKPRNISALAIVGGRLVIGSDETSFVQVLTKSSNG